MISNITRKMRLTLAAGIAITGLAGLPGSASAVGISTADTITLSTSPTAVNFPPTVLTAGAAVTTFDAVQSFSPFISTSIGVIAGVSGGKDDISVAFDGVPIALTLGDIDLDTVGYSIVGLKTTDGSTVAGLTWTVTANSVTFAYDGSGLVGGFTAPPSEFVNFTILTAAVPEPMSLALLGLGLAGFGFARRRKG